MEGNPRKTGIEIIGETPWGSHFCQFYHTTEDLVEILVPYFKAGLENNELCMWVTSRPLSVRQATEALKKALPESTVYLQKGQLEIVSSKDWYVRNGGFDAQAVLKGWMDKLDHALAAGYDGLRLSGNTFWLEKKDWPRFVSYEEEIDKIIGNRRMIALCTYSLLKCSAAEIIDVMNNHQVALVKREGAWAMLENSERKRIELVKAQLLHENMERLRLKLDSILLPDGDIGNLNLEEIIHVSQIQSIMDDFFKVTGIGLAIIDLQGKVLVATGWQDICTQFHRIHHDTCAHCIESDTVLSREIEPNTYKIYKCRNNMWVIATPIMIGGRHMGNLFLGQFFFEDEVPDAAAFRFQAKRYGFDEKKYLEALDRVPRWSRETVDNVMTFYTKFAGMISSLSFSNVMLARTLSEQRQAKETMRENEAQFKLLAETAGRLLAAEDPQHIINDVCTRVMEHLECQVFFNFMSDDRKGRLHLNSYTGIPEDEARKIEWIDYGTGVCGCAAREKCRIIAEDIRNTHDSGTELVESLGIQAYCCHPLIAQGKVIGTLSFGTGNRPYFSDNDINLMRIVADQVSVAMQRIQSRTRLKAALADAEKNGNELDRLNRTLMAHNKSTHAMMRATDEIEYLQEICTIIVEDCGHAMVWIGYAEQDEARTVIPVACSGFEEGYLETLNLTWADTERGRGPTGTAIRTGKISTCRKMLTDPFFRPWREEALKRGYASSIAFPLHNGNKAFGAITIYSREPDPFYEDEVKLLDELAKDLAYGIHTIRLRIAHDQAQKELLAHREHLEILVKERTLQLEERNRQLEEEITVRKRTEKALRKSTEEIRDLYNKAPCGYHSLNKDGVFVRINDTELNWLGYDREEVVGKMKFSDILTPKSHKLFKSSFSRFKKQGWISDLEHEVVRKDGSVMPVLLSATAIRDQDGNFVMSRSSLFDISERKQLDREIRNAADDWQTTFDSIKDQVMILDKEFRIIRINAAAASFFDHSLDKVRHSRCFSLMHHAEGPIQGCPFALALKTKKHEEMEHFDTIRNRWFLESVDPIVNKKGEIIRVIHTRKDVTERKRSVEALKESEAKYRFLTEKMNDVVWTADLNLRVTYISPSIEKILGFSVEEYLERGLRRILTPGSYTQVEAILRQELERDREKPVDADRTVKIEMELYDKDGSGIWMESLATGIRDQDGMIVGIHCVSREITERKRSEEEKERLEKQLSQAHKMEALGTMAGGIAHDFNNILQPILINSELISDMLNYGTQEREYLDQIVEAAQLGKNLVGQIKLFSARKKKEYKPIVMSTVVDDALDFFKCTIPAEISFRHWISDTGDRVQADPTQIYQLIINLCMNAVQSIKTGRGFLGISLKKTVVKSTMPAMISDIKPGWYIKLKVRDTGCGIPQDVMSRIFDPFFTTKSSIKGTGLGLAIVHEVIKNVGGSIRIHSAVGKGTRFEIYFPLYQGAHDALADLRHKAMANRKEKHILLVDDSMVELQSIHQLLLHLGHRVASTSDPHEALDLFRDDPGSFDMIITDQVMPRMRGHMLAMKIRRIRKDIPVIICSGSEEILLELKEREKEIGEFILKPFSSAQLVDAMDRVLGLCMQS